MAVVLDSKKGSAEPDRSDDRFVTTQYRDSRTKP